jgi:ribosomal protein S27E
VTRLICEGCGADATQDGRAYAGAPCPFCGGVLTAWKRTGGGSE